MLELKSIGYILAIWFAGLLVIFLAGSALNTITSRRIKQFQIQSTDHTGVNERLILRLHDILIIVASVYFYISIPMLILAMGALIILLYNYFFLAIIAAVVGFFNVISLVLSIFKKAGVPYLGSKLAKNDAPRLWLFTDNISSQLRSQQPDTIYITPWQKITISEQGKIWDKMRGTSQTCLILGLGVITGLRQDSFRIILTSLFNQLSSRNVNTLLALHLEESVYKTINQFKPSTRIQWLNPITVFMYIYHLFFQHANSNASRMERLLGDHVAVKIYGLTNVLDAIIDLEYHAICFNKTVMEEIKRVYLQSDQLENVYRLLTSSTTKQEEQMKEDLRKSFQAPDFPYHNLQPLFDRLSLVNNDNASKTAHPTVLELIPNFEELQIKMTRTIAVEAF